jgi:hypothetical protein
MPMWKSRFTEEQIAHALRQGGDRNAGHRGVPGDGGERAGLLPLEEAVRWAGGQRDSRAEATRGIEPPAQAAGSRSFAR